MKNILLFGDSNTYGYKPDGSGRFDENIRWTGLVKRHYGEKNFNMIEEGLCGRTTIFDDELRQHRRGADILPMLLETHSPLDIVVIMLGTNDCKTRFKASSELIAKGIEVLTNQVEAYNGTGNRGDMPKILLISPIVLGNGVGEPGFDPEFAEQSEEVSQGLSASIQKVAQKHGYHYLAASNFAQASHIDKEHLDENGHNNLANAVIQKLNEMMEL